MGDVPSIRDAVPNVNLQTINLDLTGPQAPGQGGRIETGGAERSVTVSRRAEPPRPRAVPRIDPEPKAAEFRRRFPKFSAFRKDYPALEHIDSLWSRSLGAFIRTVQAIAASTGDEFYTALLLEFGPKVLQEGLARLKNKEYGKNTTHRTFNTNSKVILNDRNAKLAARHNYNMYCITSRSQELFYRYYDKKSWKLSERYNKHKLFGTDGSAKVYLRRFAHFTDKIPGGQGLFRTNETYSSYFKTLFNTTVTERFIDRCSQELHDDDEPRKSIGSGKRSASKPFGRSF